MILFLLAIYFNFGSFHYSCSVTDLIFGEGTFRLFAQDIFTISWLWENTSLLDLIRIWVIYYALSFCYGLALGIYAAWNHE
jgi:hypothetical protein